MFPAVDNHLTQRIRYFCLISFDYISLFIFLCVRDCKGLLIKLRCNTGEHVTCVQNTQDAISQSMTKACECPGCWVDCYGLVEVLYIVHGHDGVVGQEVHSQIK